MNKFDSIRPYTDNEVNEVLLDLSNNRRFLKMLFANGEYSYLRLLPFSRKILGFILRNKVKSIHDVQSYQNFFESIVNNVVENSIKNFTVNGIENLNPNTGYLFVSNHRDITLDSALLNLTLHKNNLGTTNNAVGNNLLSEKWASDLMRLNKSFIIDRSDKSKREIYQSLNLASEFIWDSISNTLEACREYIQEYGEEQFTDQGFTENNCSFIGNAVRKREETHRMAEANKAFAHFRY